jgi:opacity protein-like surface antigen
MRRLSTVAAACGVSLLLGAAAQAQVGEGSPAARPAVTESRVIRAQATTTSQQGDRWEMSVVPLYFWAMGLNGQLSAASASVPISLDFADAADNLGGAFSVHFEASRGRWGVLTDVNFIRLSSSAPITVGSLEFERDLQLDNVMFEAGVSYLLHRTTRFGLIGGVRTYTLSPTIELTNTVAGVTPIDDTRTSADAFVGVTYRPRFNQTFAFIGRADIGAGNADLTWSTVVGLEYRFKPWGSLDFGFKALGIDTKSEEHVVREYDVTHYGPIFGLRLHWTR